MIAKANDVWAFGFPRVRVYDNKKSLLWSTYGHKDTSKFVLVGGSTILHAIANFYYNSKCGTTFQSMLG